MHLVGIVKKYLFVQETVHAQIHSLSAFRITVGHDEIA